MIAGFWRERFAVSAREHHKYLDRVGNGENHISM